MKIALPASFSATLVVSAVLSAAPAAAAVYYHGLHPIPDAYGGGLCQDEGTHPHDFVPVDLDYYQVQDGTYYWIGDPAVEGEDEGVVLYWYELHHPVPVVFGGGYCYIVGPHRHWWSPSAHYRHYYVLRGGKYVYRGPWGKSYRSTRKLAPWTWKGPHARHSEHTPHAAGSGPAGHGATGHGAAKRHFGPPTSPKRAVGTRMGTPDVPRRPFYDTRIERRQQPGWRAADTRQPPRAAPAHRPTPARPSVSLPPRQEWRRPVIHRRAPPVRTRRR